MKKKRLNLVVAILGLLLTISFQSNAQDYVFSIHQDHVLMHCDTRDSTSVYLTLSDPNGELTGPFTVDWQVNGIIQLEAGLFTTDTLHLRDTVIYEVFDGTTTSVWLDSIYIQDESRPNLMIYPGYQRASHACYGTGRTKLQVPMPYIIENISILNGYGNELISEGNHAMIDSIMAGNYQMKYSINACNYYYEFTIESEDKPNLEMYQEYLATCNDGKFNLILSDSFVIDSVWLNNREMLVVDDTTYHLHVPGGDNEIIVFAKACEFYENFFVESEEANQLRVESVVFPHENLSTGSVNLSSTVEIKEASYIIGETETTVLFDENAVNYDYLPAGEYIFRVKDAGDCLTDIEYILENLTGNPIPTGFSADSIFDFKIDGIPINRVSEVGSQYRLMIHKTSGVDRSQLVFDTERGDILPWNKKLNGEVQYGYFLYYLEITNPKYTGKNPIKSYFRIFKEK